MVHEHNTSSEMSKNMFRLLEVAMIRTYTDSEKATFTVQYGTVHCVMSHVAVFWHVVLCCAVLCCVVLCCMVLCCVVLCCVVLCVELCCVVFCCIVLCCRTV
jgi:hypothetical protein